MSNTWIEISSNAADEIKRRDAEIERLRATNERLAIQNERMRAALIAYRHATSNTTFPSTHPIWLAFKLDDAARADLAEQEKK